MKKKQFELLFSNVGDFTVHCTRWHFKKTTCAPLLRKNGYSYRNNINHPCKLNPTCRQLNRWSKCSSLITKIPQIFSKFLKNHYWYCFHIKRNKISGRKREMIPNSLAFKTSNQNLFANVVILQSNWIVCGPRT